MCNSNSYLTNKKLNAQPVPVMVSNSIQLRGLAHNIAVGEGGGGGGVVHNGNIQKIKYPI